MSGFLFFYFQKDCEQMDNLDINGTYNFETYAPVWLGAKFKNAKLTAIMDYNLAVKFFNPSSHQANVYPSLPIGTPRDHTKYTYYHFRTQNGTEAVFAKEWINMSSVELVTGNTIQVTIFQTTNQDIKNIRELLVSAGYNSISLDII